MSVKQCIFAHLFDCFGLPDTFRECASFLSLETIYLPSLIRKVYRDFCNCLHASDFLSSVCSFHITYVSLIRHDTHTEKPLPFSYVIQKNFSAIKIFRKTSTVIRNNCPVVVFSTYKINYQKPCQIRYSNREG